jgi:predicted nuclease of predicted toxin-antitoxin system
VKIWRDAHLSPATARWLADALNCEAIPVRELDLRDALDKDIYLAARGASAIVMTKDSGFAALQARLGPPPQVIWLRCGNTSNARLQEILNGMLPTIVVSMLSGGESLIEVLDPS